MPGASASAQPRLAGMLAGRLVEGLPTEEHALARSLGLDPEQIGFDGDGALRAKLDVPPGQWRIWPRIALWVSERIGARPPAIGEPTALDLGRVLLKLRQAGVKARDIRMCDEHGWSGPLSTADALRRMTTSEPSGISALWFTADRPAALVQVHRDGALWGRTESDIVWWAMEVTSA